MPSRRKTLMLFAVMSLAAPPPESPGVAVHYEPPVPGPVVDPFRPPANPFGPGNRGLEYATTPGEAVRAAAAGTVIFAGQVGGGLDVVVLHGDNLRSSYTGLAAIDVAKAQAVRTGDPIGRAGSRLH